MYKIQINTKWQLKTDILMSISVRCPSATRQHFTSSPYLISYMYQTHMYYKPRGACRGQRALPTFRSAGAGECPSEAAWPHWVTSDTSLRLAGRLHGSAARIPWRGWSTWNKQAGRIDNPWNKFTSGFSRQCTDPSKGGWRKGRGNFLNPLRD